MEQELIYWVRERENIRKKKEAGEPWPWTDDLILQTYRFCNVRRRDDKVSRWIRENIHEQEFEELDLLKFLQLAAIARYINWPPSILEIIWDQRYEKSGPPLFDIREFNLQKAVETLYERQKRGEKIWTGAYMVRGYLNESKIDYILLKVCGEYLEGRIFDIKASIRTNSKEAVANSFDRINGWGSFMAGQVTDDLTWSSLLPNPIDQNTWAPVGPGSKRGYNRMVGRPLIARIDYGEWKYNLINWRQMIMFELGSEFNNITAHDIQNCLCEFDKYMRIKNGEGRMRNKYKPKPEGQW